MHERADAPACAPSSSCSSSFLPAARENRSLPRARRHPPARRPPRRARRPRRAQRSSRRARARSRPASCSRRRTTTPASRPKACAGRADVPRGAQRIRFAIDAAGPPTDGSFTSAAMQVYMPGATGAMVNELPGQEKRNYTLEQHGYEGTWGTWKVDFGGTGKTSVTLRVSVE